MILYVVIPKLRTNPSGSINYKCRHRNEKNLPCPASITILNGEVVRGVFDHNHKPLSNVEFAAIETTQGIKELAATTRIPLQQIYSEEQGKLVNELSKTIIEERSSILEEVAQSYPDFLNMKSGLAKIRSKNQPKLPQTITQIDFEGDYTITHSQYKYLLFDNKKKK